MLHVFKCSRCGEGEIHLIEIVGHYLVECELCGQRGPLETTTKQATVAWNEKQRSLMRVAGNDYIH